jgi:hypothetical protein
MSLVDAAAYRVSLRLPANEDLSCNQNSTVVAARDDLSQFGLSVLAIVNLIDIEENWSLDRLNHLFPSQILVVTSKIDYSRPAASEDRMVVSSRDEINGMVKLDLDWYLFNALAPECSFVIAAECEDSSFHCRDYSVESAASDLVNTSSEQRIGYRSPLGLPFRFLFLILQSKSLDIGKAYGPFRLHFLLGMVVLIRLARSKDIELQSCNLLRFLGGLLRLFATHWLVDANYLRYINQANQPIYIILYAEWGFQVLPSTTVSEARGKHLAEIKW